MNHAGNEGNIFQGAWGFIHIIQYSWKMGGRATCIEELRQAYKIVVRKSERSDQHLEDLGAVSKVSQRNGV